jgi:hypothetical protein
MKVGDIMRASYHFINKWKKWAINLHSKIVLCEVI